MNKSTHFAVQLDGNDLLAAVQAQRNDAMDAAASNAAAMQALRRKIQELEAKLKAKEERDGNQHGNAAEEKDAG